jgi:phosphinothricin acetyltransferase
MIIKEMRPEHWESVKKIFELGIATGIATFETKAPEWEIWDKNHLTHSRLVCVIDKRVAGWVSISAVSGRSVYGGVAEISIYIHPSFKGTGMGFVLLDNVISESEKNGIWTLQAGIFEDNKSSIRLHEKSGFRKVGYRERIGKLNNQWFNIVVFEKRSKNIGLS